MTDRGYREIGEWKTNWFGKKIPDDLFKSSMRREYNIGDTRFTEVGEFYNPFYGRTLNKKYGPHKNLGNLKKGKRISSDGYVEEDGSFDINGDLNNGTRKFRDGKIENVYTDDSTGNKKIVYMDENGNIKKIQYRNSRGNLLYETKGQHIKIDDSSDIPNYKLKLGQKTQYGTLQTITDTGSFDKDENLKSGSSDIYDILGSRGNKSFIGTSQDSYTSSLAGDMIKDIK